MQLLVNDLSIAGQFPDLSAFRDAINRIMEIRAIAQQFGRELHCHRNIANAQVTWNMKLPQAIQSWTLNEQRAVMQWVTKKGPFWDDDRSHGPDDYLEFNEEVVTDTAVGEAAYCCSHGIDRHLVSLIPSSWEFSPISVNWVLDDEARRHIDVVNHWEVNELEVALRAAPTPVASWEQLAAVCQARCSHLTFSADSFEPLRGLPFIDGAAERILVLLDTLEALRRCVDNQGRRTPEGNRILANHFSGGKAWFTDSSTSEKNEFNQQLTFPHPQANGEYLFCTWHGKVKTPPQFRIHFSDPFHVDEPLYVVYIGPKITKQ